MTKLLSYCCNAPAAINYHIVGDYHFCQKCREPCNIYEVDETETLEEAIAKVDPPIIALHYGRVQCGHDNPMVTLRDVIRYLRSECDPNRDIGYANHCPCLPSCIEHLESLIRTK